MPRPDDGYRAAVVRLDQFDEAEVDQLDRAARRHLDVGRLDVTMDDWRVLAVHVLQRIEQLRCSTPTPVFL